MKSHISLSVFLCLSLFPLFSGCFFTSQSYNHGKLLNPGESLFTMGAGSKTFTRLGKEYVDTGGTIHYRTDSSTYIWFTPCIDYRLGFLEKYPFGKGVDIGFHVEGMLTSIRSDLDGEKEVLGYPPVMEMSARLGFRDKICRRSIYHHNLTLGWIIGFWIDNGWLVEYASGWEFEHTIPYFSIRGFLSPTNTFNKFDEGDMLEKSFWEHNRKANVRITGGISLKLPAHIPVLPDFISPEASLTFPNYSVSRSAGYSFSLGLQWMNGI